MLAVEHQHFVVVVDLLRVPVGRQLGFEPRVRGADVDVINDRGQTPLAGAVFKGYPDVVTALVAAGADADRGSPTARAAAVFFERPDLAALLPSEA